MMTSRNWRMKSTFCMAKWFADNRPISQMPECTCFISHNAPFLFWMEHCGIWNRVILAFVNQINSMKAAETQINSLEVYYPGVAELVDYPSRRVIYTSFIASNFNYCPLVWFSRAEKVNKIDRIQEGTLITTIIELKSGFHSFRIYVAMHLWLRYSFLRDFDQIICLNSLPRQTPLMVRGINANRYNRVYPIFREFICPKVL